MKLIIHIAVIVIDVVDFLDPCIFVSAELKIVVHLVKNMAL